MNFNPHAFSLRQLQYIVAVADLLSFNRAADECHVSQPSLSLQIAELERVLAIKIFERDAHRVALTAAGRDFVESARVVLHAADALLETARRGIDPFSGTLRIGVIPTISPYWLPELASALRKAYPHLTVIWVEDKTHMLVHALQSGAIDAALLALEAEIGDVEREVIAKDPFVLVAPAGNPLVAKGTPAKASELRGATVMVLEDEHCFGKQALEFCLHAKAQQHQFRGTSLPTVISMVAGGVGVTLLPTLAVRNEVRMHNLRVRRFADAEAVRTIGLVWRKNSFLTPALRKLATSMSRAYPKIQSPTQGEKSIIPGTVSAENKKLTLRRGDAALVSFLSQQRGALSRPKIAGDNGLYHATVNSFRSSRSFFHKYQSAHPPRVPPRVRLALVA